jgi:succinyl-CoA synthetase beta subunit
MVKFIDALYKMHILDLMHVLKSTRFKTSDNKIMAVDAKVNIDDNALYRQKAYADMRDIREENQSK